MTDRMKLYWEARREIIPDEDVLEQSTHTLYDYRTELIEGPLVDIGCGQTSALINFLDTDRDLYLIDTDVDQFITLKGRFETKAGAESGERWHFLGQSFPETPLPDVYYSAVVLSNLLHFLDAEKCRHSVEQIKERTLPGALIYVLVHSVKSPFNTPDDTHFKHFFTAEELLTLFSVDDFECIRLDEAEKTPEELEIRILDRWMEKQCAADGITIPAYINWQKENDINKQVKHVIELIVKRR